MKIINNLKKFISNPDFLRSNFETPAKKGLAFLGLFLTCLTIVMIVSTFTAILRWFAHIDFKTNDIPLIYFWGINIVIIPFVEETAYRLPLVYHRLYISLSSLIISYIFISYGFGVNMLNFSEGLFIRLVIPFAIFCLFYLALGFENINRRFAVFWSKNQKVIIYLSLISFTFRHMDNYVLTTLSIALSPILLFPQFTTGIFLSFVRIRFGFTFSILFHFLINVAAFLPQILLYYVSK